MLHGFDLFAIAADATRNSRSDGSGAVQRLSEAQCQSPPAQAGRSAEKIRVAYIPARRVVGDLESTLEKMDKNVNSRLLAEVLLLDWPKV